MSPLLFAGKNLLLLPVARVLFNHVWDVLKDVPSFQSEYSVLIRHLLAIAGYRFHMRKRVYSSKSFPDLVYYCVYFFLSLAKICSCPFKMNRSCTSVHGKGGNKLEH